MVQKLVEKLFISGEEIKKLMDWQSKKGILSVYINTDERDITSSQKFQGLVRSEIHNVVQTNARDEELKRVSELALTDLLNIPTEMRRRSFVYFRNADNEKVFMRSLQFPLKSQSIWMKASYIRPLVALYDEAPKLGIVLLSKELVRVMTWYQGIIDESTVFEIPMEVGYVYMGEDHMVSSGFDRLTIEKTDISKQKVTADIRRKLSGIAGEISKYGDKNGWKNISLIGSVRLTDILEENLPVKWQDRIIGKLNKNYINSRVSQVEEKTTEVLSQWKKKVQEKIVKDVISLAKSGGRAVIGIRDTLRTLKENRVERLIFGSDIVIEGYRDIFNNLYIEVDENEIDMYQDEPYIIERMIQKAFSSSSRVTPIENSALELLRPYDGVAAMLRY